MKSSFLNGSVGEADLGMAEDRQKDAKDPHSEAEPLPAIGRSAWALQPQACRRRWTDNFAEKFTADAEGFRCLHVLVASYDL